MQPASKLPPAVGLDQNISHLKNLFASSFPTQDMDPPAMGAELQSASSLLAFEADQEEDIDWSITLGNIRELTERAKESEARVHLAEARAARAEAKAKEAKHWLRLLHKAVLEGSQHKPHPSAE